MKIGGHCDAGGDIAWLRFEGYDPTTAVAEEIETGLRETDPATGVIVGLEHWQASTTLPADFLQMLRRRSWRRRLIFEARAGSRRRPIRAADSFRAGEKRSSRRTDSNRRPLHYE